MQMSVNKNFFALLVFAALVFAAAIVGSMFEPGEWYAELNKPEWTPPDWLFAPVWSLLYIAIAIAGWLAWKNSANWSSFPVILWGIQLVLNALWSWIFFGLHNPFAAFVNIVILLAAILLFIFRVNSTLAAILFTIYALWITFAAILNFEVMRLN